MNTARSPGTAADDAVRAVPRKTAATIILALLATSLVAVAIAPALMPDSYSWMEHAVSESAAQGVERAWVARLGFLLLGFAVLLLAGKAGRRWGVWGRSVHRVYGISMIAAAAFAHSPWEDVPFDEFEDSLHSIAASAVGFSFTVGVLIVSFRRGPAARPTRVFDKAAVIAALVLPMVMFNVTGIAGVVQRVLFLIG